MWNLKGTLWNSPKISLPRIERCVGCWEVKTEELPDLRARKRFWNAPRSSTRNKANLRDLIAATGLVFLLKIGFKSLIFGPMWPGNLMEDLKKTKTIGHLLYTMSSSVHHFKAIGEFKLELQSGNVQFGSKLVIFCPLWPQNLTDDLEKQ